MNVLFDRLSHQVVGVNRPALPFEYALELEGTPILSKTISQVVGQVQKTDEEGNPLYYFEGEEVTFPEYVFEAVYEEIEREVEVERYEDVDGDGDLEKVIDTEIVTDKVEVLPGEVVILEPVMVDKLEYHTVTFEQNPFEFDYDEVSKAELKYSLEKQNEALQLENQLLGMQMVHLKMDNMDKAQIIDYLGEEVTKIKLELLLGQAGK